MGKTYGKKTWLIPDCYLNSVSKNESVSHEAICVINTTDVDAKNEWINGQSKISNELEVGPEIALLRP